MKILFLTDNFPPEVNAPATRTYEHCCEWVKSGVEVTVITCAPNFPKGKVFEEPYQLFNMKEDRTEMNHLAAEMPEKFSMMKKSWTEWALKNGVRITDDMNVIRGKAK